MLYVIVGTGLGNVHEVKNTLKSLVESFKSEDGESDAYFSITPPDHEWDSVVTQYLTTDLPYYITFGGQGTLLQAEAAEARDGGLFQQQEHALQEKADGYPVELLVLDSESLTEAEFDVVETLIRSGIKASDLCNQMLPLTIETEDVPLEEAPLVEAPEGEALTEDDLNGLTPGELRALVDERGLEVSDRRKKEVLIAALLAQPTKLVDMKEDIDTAIDAANEPIGPIAPELERLLAEEAEIEARGPLPEEGVATSAPEPSVSPAGELLVSLCIKSDGTVTAGVGEPNAGELARLDGFLRSMPNYDGNPVDFAIHLIKVGYGL